MQPESLPDLLKFDHGYTAMSPPIRNVSYCSFLDFRVWISVLVLNLKGGEDRNLRGFS